MYYSENIRKKKVKELETNKEFMAYANKNFDEGVWTRSTDTFEEYLLREVFTIYNNFELMQFLQTADKKTIDKVMSGALKGYHFEGGATMKIEKVYPAGWKMETDNETIYFGEYGSFGCYCNTGVVYKDRDAFETGNGVCYIPEYGFDNGDENAGQLFEFCAKQYVASDLEENTYVATDGYSREDLEELCKGTGYDADDLFDHLDWMYPETLLDEWQRDDEEEE